MILRHHLHGHCVFYSPLPFTNFNELPNNIVTVIFTTVGIRTTNDNHNAITGLVSH